jgi:hypothetical protein
MPRTQSAAEDLVIVEAPATAMTIARDLGPGGSATARRGIGPVGA